MPRLSKIGAAALGAFGWTSGSSISASYLQVAGGGGGGCTGSGGGAGGGGAGGYLTGTTSLSLTTTYTVTVGAGGAGKGGGDGNGTQGSSSQFGTLTASVGGGYGGLTTGGTGGSGGGGSNNSSAGGSATSGQGNAGGTGGPYSGNFTGGGGGGAGAVGGNGASSVAGNGGNGSIAPAALGGGTYAGGGGGGTYNGGTRGTGGTGGGGNGDAGNSNNATSGTANLGGGGGGGGYGSTYETAGNGGSGVVIISYAGAQQFGGGVVTSSGGYTIHTFNTSGTLAPIASLSASYLIVAGGGGGSGSQSSSVGGGGGGAGGLLTGSGTTIDTNSTYVITVGSGGVGGTTGNALGTNGGNSVFSIVSTAAVGGGYGSWVATSGSGGSGGGLTDSVYVALSGSGVLGSATSGQGNIGAYATLSSGSGTFGGGGGGAGGAGNGSGGVSTAGNGGVGLANPISGSTAGQLVSSTYYLAGGGGGGSGQLTGTFGGSGGNGGGGNGSYNANGIAGTVNTGGGGGGAGSAGASGNKTGGSGGSGIVIISYAGATQSMAGGTVTISGGNVIHTFTSSGYLTPLKLVNNSLRFRYSNSAYLNRTPTVSSNRTTWTYSYWFKGMNATASVDYWSLCAFSDGNNYTSVRHHNGYYIDVLSFNGGSAVSTVKTANLFRDPAAWNHMVIVFDTSNATQADRIQIYQNGVRCAIQGGATYPAGGSPTGWVNAASTVHYIGRQSTEYFDGYMTEINMVDGQALTPNSFGTFNSYGVWQPITYGGSYGTNGFYLPFTAGTSTYVGSYNGSTAWFNTSNNSAFAFGTGSLTVEAFVYPTQNSYGSIFDTRSTASSGPGISIYANSGNGIILVNNTTYNPSSYLPLNQWSHIAAVRNGASAWTVYINGKSVLTFTDSSNLTDNACFSGKNYAGSAFFGGSISNLRVVKGTAVYTSEFTPSTSPLTAISGTSLLTLQNSTLIDNSTNAFSLTNTGPITLGTSYPFSAAKIFNDQSPAGNNWTPNNISGASGSTLDYMTDVPTLTSATVANYPTLNPLNPPTGLTTFTYSNGNLAIVSANGASSPATESSSYATMYFPSTGKFYAEMTVGTTFGTGSNSWPRFGVAGYGMGIGGYVNFGGSSYGTFVTGNVMMVAWDSATGYIWWGKDGTWLNSGVPASGTGYISTFTYAASSAYVNLSLYCNTSNNSGGSVNFGQQPFAYTPPSGFVALNAWNL